MLDFVNKVGYGANLRLIGKRLQKVAPTAEDRSKLHIMCKIGVEKTGIEVCDER